MPQICTVCRHEQRDEIDKALVAGQPLRGIALRFGTSAAALFRHKQRDIPITLAASKHAAGEVRAETLFDWLKEMNHETAAILRDAQCAGNHAIALQAIARAEKQIELEARLLGGLNDATKVAVGISVTPAQPRLDWSVLSLEELEQLERIHQKLESARQRVGA